MYFISLYNIENNYLLNNDDNQTMYAINDTNNATLTSAILLHTVLLVHIYFVYIRVILSYVFSLWNRDYVIFYLRKPPGLSPAKVITSSFCGIYD